MSLPEFLGRLQFSPKNRIKCRMQGKLAGWGYAGLDEGDPFLFAELTSNEARREWKDPCPTRRAPLSQSNGSLLKLDMCDEVGRGREKEKRESGEGRGRERAGPARTGGRPGQKRGV